MNIKTILASALLATLFAGTTAFAEDRDNLFAWELNAIATESVEMQKVSYQAPSLNTEVTSVSGRI